MTPPILGPCLMPRRRRGNNLYGRYLRCLKEHWYKSTKPYTYPPLRLRPKSQSGLVNAQVIRSYQVPNLPIVSYDIYKFCDDYDLWWTSSYLFVWIRLSADKKCDRKVVRMYQLVRYRSYPNLASCEDTKIQAIRLLPIVLSINRPKTISSGGMSQSLVEYLNEAFFFSFF